MRRILVALGLLVATTACAPDAEPPAAPRETVPVGRLPGALPSAPGTSAAPSGASTVAPGTVAETAPGSSSPPRGDGTGEGTAPATTARAAVDAGTSFAVEVGGLARELVPPPSQLLVDDTGRVELAVPAAWTDVRTVPARANGRVVPSLSAAPDMTAFLDGFGAPGVTAVVVDGDPDEALDTYDFHEECVAGGRAPFRSAGREGAYDVWWQCGGTDTDIVTVAVRPPGSSSTVLLLAQLVDPADAVVLDHALATLTIQD
jgi:hypothetical protein